MARHTGADCKLCRREGMKLFLKGVKCSTNKCTFDKKGYAPGEHGQKRRFKQSEYAIQLREKQKLKRMYGLFENQFHNYFEKADKRKGVTGENLLKLLECRLDNVVYRLGLASSRDAARQLVKHRHFTLNGKRVDIPSIQVKPGDLVQVIEKSRQMDVFHDSMKRVREGKMVPWLELDKANMKGNFLQVPDREEIPINVNEQLVVELYSK
ncbi:MAG: 30S ribosomal protein S4 [candidate division KSB1 bacterium]|nr:30S ribosomal protein S4 [candidate division KSB1 bacterium]